MRNDVRISKTLEHIKRLVSILSQLGYTMYLSAYQKAIDDWAHVRNLADEIDDEILALSRLWPEDKFELPFYKLSQSARGMRDLMVNTETVDELNELTEIDSLLIGIVYSGIPFDIETILEAVSKHIPSVIPVSLSELSIVQITYEDIRRNPQAAVQQAFTHFEDLLRDRIGTGPDVYGKDLINRAFGKNGCLTYGATPAEQTGVRDLMAGAYSLFRNPRMHRITQDDERTALTLISVVDLLMQIVNEAEDR